MAAGGAGAAGDASQAITRLSREVTLLERKPVPGVRPVPGSAENPLEWKLYITGPEFYNVNGERRKCPYGGRVFEATVKYPASYPFTHPDVAFKPGELLHPNILRETGELCALVIKESWGPVKNTGDLAKMLMAFLETPNMGHPLDGEAAALCASDIAKYEAAAAAAAAKAPKA